MRLSCSSLAFSDMGWERALEEIRGLGFRAADLAMFEGWTHVNPSELLDPEGHGARIHAACRDAGVAPIAIHAGFRPPEARDFPGLTTPDPAAREGIRDQFRRVAACAAAAGVPLVNLQPGRFLAGAPPADSLARAAELLREMLAEASRLGIALSVENHAGSIAEQPEDALALLNAVPGLALDFDPSHVVARSIPLERTLPLMGRVVHVGVRNARPGSYNEPVRGGGLDYDLDAFLSAFRRAGFGGFVSVEYFEPRMRESIPALKALLEAGGVLP